MTAQLTLDEALEALRVKLAPPTALTAAELDDWTAEVRASRSDVHHFPADWAREGLGAILGEDFPHRMYTRRELLGHLGRARAALAA